MKGYLQVVSTQLENLKSLLAIANETARVATATPSVVSALQKTGKMVSELERLFASARQPVQASRLDSTGTVTMSRCRQAFGRLLYSEITALEPHVDFVEMRLSDSTSELSACAKRQLDQTLREANGDDIAAGDVLPRLLAINAARALEFLAASLVAMLHSTAAMIANARTQMIVEALLPASARSVGYQVTDDRTSPDSKRPAGGSCDEVCC